jgi:Tfp pilus assembly protein FimT
MVLVTAVLGILAAVIAPSLETLGGTSRLTGAADTVRARWADARSRAIEEGRPYRFSVMSNSGKFRLAPDSPEFWDGASGSTPPAAPGDAPQDALVIEDELQGDVLFNATDGGGETWSNPVIFLPDGTARDDAEVAFAQGGASVVLRLRAVTGTVTMSQQSVGSPP